MTGAPLSRWTLSYFAAALAALLLAEMLMAAGWGYPSAPVESPRTLVVVHVVAIGWLSMLMCGALFQFLPVLVNRPLSDGFLALPALLFLLAGLAALLSGFLGLDGAIDGGLPFFPLAALLLGIGFALVVWTLGRTLASARPLPLPALFVALGLAGLSATVALGILFALVLDGAVGNPWLIAIAAEGVPVHAASGLGFWLTLCAMGVSYRLFSMFLLAPELDRRGTRVALRLAACALAIAGPGAVLAMVAGMNVDVILLAAGAPALAALGLYGRDVLHLYRARKRRSIELNARMSVLAFASLGMAVLLALVLLPFGAFAGHGPAVVFLAAFGWLSGLGLAKLYKIVAFMTWLECYGPVLGRKPTPRVQDLVVEKRAEKWFLLYFMSAWAGTAALLVGQPALFQAAAAAMLGATVGLVVQLLRTRRLLDVGSSARFPEGAVRPALLWSLAHGA